MRCTSLLISPTAGTAQSFKSTRNFKCRTVFSRPLPEGAGAARSFQIAFLPPFRHLGLVEPFGCAYTGLRGRDRRGHSW